MQSEVEEKAYEFGLMRALGLRKHSLILLLLIESAFFAVPGFLFGLLWAQILTIGIAYIFFSTAQTVSSYALTLSSVGIAGLLGLAVPLFGNYLPIRHAM